MIARVLSIHGSVRGLAAALIVVLMIASPWRVGAAHKFHVSLTQIEVNANSKTVEFGMRVFVDDLEEALTRRAGRRIRLGATSNFDALALAYVAASLKLDDASGKRLVFTWIGKETSVDVVWLYVEAPLAAPIEGGRLENGMFFELFDDQVNTVNIKAGRRRSTLTFSTGDSAKPVTLTSDDSTFLARSSCSKSAGGAKEPEPTAQAVGCSKEVCASPAGATQNPEEGVYRPPGALARLSPYPRLAPWARVLSRLRRSRKQGRL